MHAIVRTGGKQYRVTEGDLIKVEKLEGEVGSEVILEDVLMVGEGEKTQIGSPSLEGVRVKGEIVDQARAKKIVVYRFKKRKGYAKKQGHRQPYTAIRVKEILGPGGKKTRRAKKKTETPEQKEEKE